NRLISMVLRLGELASWPNGGSKAVVASASTHQGHGQVLRDDLRDQVTSEIRHEVCPMLNGPNAQPGAWMEACGCLQRRKRLIRLLVRRSDGPSWGPRREVQGS